MHRHTFMLRINYNYYRFFALERPSVPFCKLCSSIIDFWPCQICREISKQNTDPEPLKKKLSGVISFPICGWLEVLRTRKQEKYAASTADTSGGPFIVPKRQRYNIWLVRRHFIPQAIHTGTHGSFKIVLSLPALRMARRTDHNNTI